MILELHYKISWYDKANIQTSLDFSIVVKIDIINLKLIFNTNFICFSKNNPKEEQIKYYNITINI